MILVLGSTGTTGSRVARALDARNVRTRLATRRPALPNDVFFDWADADSRAHALQGITGIYLVAPVGSADPMPVVGPFLESAVQQGVRRVVALSSSAMDRGAPGLGEVHDAVASIVPEWAVLRPSWFMQNFIGRTPLSDGVRNGEIVSATGEGRIAFVDALDIADVAAHSLTDPEPHNTDHILTGPSPLSYSDAAAVISAQIGTEISHRSITVDELAQRHSDHGLPAGFARILAALDADIARGTEDRATDVVERVTGHPARNFEDFVKAHFETVL
ncbi:ergot alkaloid biosynthesis protein [Rhodococcus ruber]|uniref:Ergot alkaloid biosynthesis protein n=1 Tax=Rhodococcus ruber TaxID=1830 RepID=A0ABT4MEG5_9NOCA|nr:ergot alkaloid biosynthesis protein [Rhodococcus ruber]MCZ4519351.1 ergot alkaloid biosynthesis protein [Rhodococcus ruber]